MRLFRTFACLTLLLAASVIPLPTYAAPDRPNIVLMMADDMGWGGVDFPVRVGESADGKPVVYPGTAHWRMPNLRAMAGQGLVFSRMYSQSPVCSPTRASVLTGRSPQRMGIPFANTGSLPNREITLAEYARSLGYATGHFGKWHLGVLTRDIPDANRGGKPDSHTHYATPLMSGFDVQYSTESKTSTYDPGTSGLTRPTRYWTGPGKYIPLDDPQLKGDDSAIIAREATALMARSVEDRRPFFVVLWFHTPHLPLNTPGNRDVDNLAAYRFAMQGMDDAIGTVRSALRELGVADNTIVCFTSDNGPEDGHDHNDDPLRANKRELYEGGVRVPGVIQWPARIRPGVTHTPMVTSDYLPTLLEIWGVEPIDNRPIDGQSLAHLLTQDRDAARTKPIVFQSTNGHQSVIGGPNGRYKLISTNKGKQWSLYDLIVDFDENQPITTTASLGTASPESRAVYDELLATYNRWAGSVELSLRNHITGDYATGIASTLGVDQHAEPPRSLRLDKTPSDRPMLYLEQQHVTLRQAVTAGKATLDSGDVVSSFLLHFNPVGAARAAEGAHGAVTFDGEILAVIVSADGLAATDALSFADPAFEPGAKRGLEPADRWSIDADGKTLRFEFNSGEDRLDQVRVLTRSVLSPQR